MMLRLQKYTVEVSYERGKNMLLADLLSRAYLPTTVDQDHEEFENVNTANLLPISKYRLDEIRVETQRDEASQALKEVILRGWPDEKKSLPSQVLPYYSVRDELTIEHDLIFKGERVVIPMSLRPLMKQKIHSSHMGVESCLRRARDCIYWPGMSSEIRQLVEACETCQKFNIGQSKETLKSHEIPSRPWEKIGVDLFTYNNKEFLITVDYYSNFWETDELSTTTAPAVIKKLKRHFARYGCPETVVSDNGPQFSCAAFAGFAKTWEFEHRTISPWNSKANGKVEAAVKMAKQLLRKAQDSNADIQLSLLDQRNTPTQGMNTSPAQAFLNRRTKALLPTKDTLLRPEVPQVEEQREKIKEKQKDQGRYYNRNAKDLPKLMKGDVVRIKPTKNSSREWRKGVVVRRIDDRSYVVETVDGTRYRRNRYNLRKTEELVSSQDHIDEIECGSEDEDTEEEDKVVETFRAPHSVAEESSPDPGERQSQLSKAARPQRQRKPPTYLEDFHRDNKQ